VVPAAARTGTTCLLRGRTVRLFQVACSEFLGRADGVLVSGLQILGGKESDAHFPVGAACFHAATLVTS